MMIKFFPYSTGPGDKAGAYPLDECGRENSPPEVMSGDMDRTVDLINGIDRKHTHTSGVISFSNEDQPSRADLLEVIKDFEAHFFAGLAKDQYDITWVRHSHLDREELHFVSPRMELTTGKALNIAPPAESNKYKERFVQAWNWTNGWSDPGDPERAREISHQPVSPGHGFKLLGTKIEIHEFLQEQILIERVTDRSSLLEALKEVGLTISRQGRDYISVKTEDGTSVRLKGRIYAKDWTYDAELNRSTTREDEKRPFRNPIDDARRAKEAWSDVKEYRSRRAEYNRHRYQRPKQPFKAARTVDLDYVRVLPGDTDHLFSISLQPELVPRPLDSRARERAVKLEDANQRGRQYGWDRSDSQSQQPASNIPPGDGASQLQSGQHSLHRDQEVDHVATDSARTRALEIVEATARRSRELRETARITADSNRRATERLGAIVGACIRAVDRALKSVRNFFTMKKGMGPAAERNGSGFSPDF